MNTTTPTAYSTDDLAQLLRIVDKTADTIKAAAFLADRARIRVYNALDKVNLALYLRIKAVHQFADALVEQAEDMVTKELEKGDCR